MAGENGIVSGMAGRYATALFELAVEANAIDAVKRDLDALDGLIASNPDLDRLVKSPVFGAEEQARAIGAVLEKAGIGGTAANFVKVVASNRRLFALREMIAGFRALVAKHKGEITAKVPDRSAPYTVSSFSGSGWVIFEPVKMKRTFFGNGAPVRESTSTLSMLRRLAAPSGCGTSM